jgi:hypothetical protein
MKKYLASILFFVIISCTYSLAQTTPTDWKSKVIGTWNYIGEEQFGVVTEPDAQNAGNKLIINEDLTFEKTDAGITVKGTYTINEGAKTITFKDVKSSKSKMYYLKKADPGYLIIEFQTPDLIRTRYKYKASK